MPTFLLTAVLWRLKCNRTSNPGDNFPLCFQQFSLVGKVLFHFFSFFIAEYCSILGSILEKINPEETMSQFCCKCNTENYFLELRLPEMKHPGNQPFVLQLLLFRNHKLLQVKNSSAPLPSARRERTCGFGAITISLISIFSFVSFPAELLWSL